MRTVFEIGSAAKALVCINRINNHDASGYLYTSFKRDGTGFDNLIGLCNLLDSWFDRYNYPQPTHLYRSFKGEKQKVVSAKKAGDVINMNEHESRGDKATFIVNVKFRQNASWQGTIQWVDGQKTQQFRSTMEMLKLIDNALKDINEPEICWED